jgi:integrase
VATVYANSRQQYSIQYGSGKARATVYLGKVPRDYAEEAGRRIERIVQSKELGEPIDAVTTAWLRACPPKLKAKLVAKGVIDDPTARTLSSLCDYCIRQAHVEPATLQKYRDAKANLLAYFGDRSIEGITAGDAHEFRTWLARKGRRPRGTPLASTTVSKRLEQARAFFASAVRKQWLTYNPFEGVTARATSGDERQFYVTKEATQALLDAADPELRLMIALCRYGGLRVPSELWPLRLDWINLETGLLQVYSPKNKRYEHKRWRFVPLFPEIRGILQDAFDAAPEGATLLFPSQGVTATAVRNRLTRLCLKCGILPWPKLWQNMRSTRETELVDAGYPIHAVCHWLGNSPAVAHRHYLQVAKEHVARAIQGADKVQSFNVPSKSSAHFTAPRANQG